MLHAQGGWVWDQATTDAEYYARDILADPIAMFFTRTRWYWYAISAVVIPGALRYPPCGVHPMDWRLFVSRLFRPLLLTQVTLPVDTVFPIRAPIESPP